MQHYRLNRNKQNESNDVNIYERPIDGVLDIGAHFIILLL